MIEHRLATYGTLSPGQANHHQMDGMTGTWRQGTVRGRCFMVGWGAAMGYPGLVADPEGEPVPVMLFESADLPQHWDRLDAFEGEGYVRSVIAVETADGLVEAQIYLLADTQPGNR